MIERQRSVLEIALSCSQWSETFRTNKRDEDFEAHSTMFGGYKWIDQFILRIHSVTGMKAAHEQTFVIDALESDEPIWWFLDGVTSDHVNETVGHKQSASAPQRKSFFLPVETTMSVTKDTIFENES